MTPDHDEFPHIIEAWLDAPEAHEDPATVLNRVLAHLDATPQGRFSWFDRGSWLMNSISPTVLALAAAATVLAFIGYQVLVGPNVGNPEPYPSGSPLGNPAAHTCPMLSASTGSETDGPLPPATGPAGKGLVAYQLGEDIYVGDPRTGETTAILSGPQRDVRPVFSPDGTAIAFQRLGATPLSDTIVVVRPDGSDPRVVVPAGVSNKEYGAPVWTPDSAAIALVHNGTTNETPYWDGELSVFDAVGSTGRCDLTPPLARAIGTFFFMVNAGVAPIFRPPDADLILDPSENGIKVFNADLALVREIGREAFDAQGLYGLGHPAWSPDASMISFGASGGGVAPHGSGVGLGGSYGTYGIYVMDADGTQIRLLSSELYDAVWSPDSSTVADWAEGSSGVGVALVDVATGAQRFLEPTAQLDSDDAWGWSWAPDGRGIVMFEPGQRPAVLDIETGVIVELPWVMDSAPSWQRVPIQ